MKYLVQTENITEEKNKDLDYDRIVLDNTDGNVYVIEPKYKLIDLGLPSGTLWMDRNVGAKDITDNGLYFQWGDTQGYNFSDENSKIIFTLEHYKYYDVSTSSFTKYNSIDNLSELDNEDDAVYKWTHGKCVMPSHLQLQELLDNTTYEPHYSNGEDYSLLISNNNGKTLYCTSGGWMGEGKYYLSYAHLWAKDLLTTDVTKAYQLSCLFNYAIANEYYSFKRHNGIQIRGVLKTN